MFDIGLIDMGQNQPRGKVHTIFAIPVEDMQAIGEAFRDTH